MSIEPEPLETTIGFVSLPGSSLKSISVKPMFISPASTVWSDEEVEKRIDGNIEIKLHVVYGGYVDSTNKLKDVVYAKTENLNFPQSLKKTGISASYLAREITKIERKLREHLSQETNIGYGSHLIIGIATSSSNNLYLRWILEREFNELISRSIPKSDN